MYKNSCRFFNIVYIFMYSYKNYNFEILDVPLLYIDFYFVLNIYVCTKNILNFKYVIFPRCNQYFLILK